MYVLKNYQYYVFSLDKGSFGSYLNISYRDNDETEMSDIRVKKSFVITNEHASEYLVHSSSSRNAKQFRKLIRYLHVKTKITNVLMTLFLLVIDDNYHGLPISEFQSD